MTDVFDFKTIKDTVFNDFSKYLDYATFFKGEGAKYLSMKIVGNNIIPIPNIKISGNSIDNIFIENERSYGSGSFEININENGYISSLILNYKGGLNIDIPAIDTFGDNISNLNFNGTFSLNNAFNKSYDEHSRIIEF